MDCPSVEAARPENWLRQPHSFPEQSCIGHRRSDPRRNRTRWGSFFASSLISMFINLRALLIAGGAKPASAAPRPDPESPPLQRPSISFSSSLMVPPGWSCRPKSPADSLGSRQDCRGGRLKRLTTAISGARSFWPSSFSLFFDRFLLKDHDFSVVGKYFCLWSSLLSGKNFSIENRRKVPFAGGGSSREA